MSNRTMKAFACTYFDCTEVIYAETASKARYERLLRLSDCCPEIEFGDISVRRAAHADIVLPAPHPITANLSHEERHRILHAYGYNNRPNTPQDWGYRDHYCTDPGCEIMAHMTQLGIFRGPCGVDEHGKTPGWCGAFWYLTDFGKEVARSLIPTPKERV